MPLTAINFKPGITRERTSYSSEGTWYDGNRIRFRMGDPEQIGGWTRLTSTMFLGICRSLNTWVTLGGSKQIGLGTNLKFYIEKGNIFHDITPLRDTEALTDPFDTTDGSTTVTVTDAAGGFVDGDFVTFSGASAVGGITLDGEYQITFVSATEYTVEAATAATSTATGGGSVTAAYQINVGPAGFTPIEGWGAGGYGLGTWGEGTTSAQAIRVWSQSNFGEDLIYGPIGGGIYQWDATNGVETRGVRLDSLGGADGVPNLQQFLLVSDVSRFVIAFGASPLDESAIDPMLIRWSDQENAVDWRPAATNQAGDLRLSRGSQIITAKQSRQEILVWTDSSLYSMQYVGPASGVWGAQLVGENTSIASPNAAVLADNVAYWMGRDKFYMYDGRVTELPCMVQDYIFNVISHQDKRQVYAGVNERFNEIWWHFCSRSSIYNDWYVVFNYAENLWYYGQMDRTAWLDSGLNEKPIATDTAGKLLQHEDGVDDESSGVPVSLNSYIESTDLDIGDGDKYMLITRVIPDIEFQNSVVASPAVTISLQPIKNPGLARQDPASLGGVNSREVLRTTDLPYEQYTAQLNIRVRCRQVTLRIASEDQGVAWQLGKMRFDMRPDGRRG